VTHVAIVIDSLGSPLAWSTPMFAASRIATTTVSMCIDVIVYRLSGCCSLVSQATSWSLGLAITRNTMMSTALEEEPKRFKTCPCVLLSCLFDDSLTFTALVFRNAPAIIIFLLGL
jgi:hypothetical protein